LACEGLYAIAKLERQESPQGEQYDARHDTPSPAEARIGQRFDALVTGALEKGTWVRVLDPPVEGKIVQGFAGLDVGDRVRVKLIDVNVERGFIDFVGVS
jgi:exoribonuclease-2